MKEDIQGIFTTVLLTCSTFYGVIYKLPIAMWITYIFTFFTVLTIFTLLTMWFVIIPLVEKHEPHQVELGETAHSFNSKVSQLAGWFCIGVMLYGGWYVCFSIWIFYYILGYMVIYRIRKVIKRQLQEKEDGRS